MLHSLPSHVNIDSLVADSLQFKPTNSGQVIFNNAFAAFEEKLIEVIDEFEDPNGVPVSILLWMV